MALPEIPNLNNFIAIIYGCLSGHAAYFKPSPTIELMLKQPKTDPVGFKDFIVNKLKDAGFNVIDRISGTSKYNNTNLEFDWLWVKVELDGLVDVVYLDSKLQDAYKRKSYDTTTFVFPGYLDSLVDSLTTHFNKDVTGHITKLDIQMLPAWSINNVQYMSDVDKTDINGLLWALRDTPIRFGAYGNNEEHMVKLIFPYVNHTNEFKNRSKDLFNLKRSPTGDLGFKN